MSDEILKLIQDELMHQNQKWGANRILPPQLWLAILGEEFGEVCKACLEHDAIGYKAELIDVAASAIAALQSLLLEEKAVQS